MELVKNLSPQTLKTRSDNVGQILAICADIKTALGNEVSEDQVRSFLYAVICVVLSALGDASEVYPGGYIIASDNFSESVGELACFLENIKKTPAWAFKTIYTDLDPKQLYQIYTEQRAASMSA